jgi:probable HAF family extracellular repeat protein
VCGYRSLDDGGSPINPRTAFKWTLQRGFVELGTPEGNTTEGYDINESGAVTGRIGTGNNARTFLWMNDQVIELGTLAEMETVPAAINNDNQIVGRSRVPLAGSQFGTNHAFFWSDGVMVDVGTLPGHNLSTASDISHDGLVLGTSSTLGEPNLHGFIWNGGIIRDINTIVMNSPVSLLESCVAISANGHIVSGGNDASSNVVTAILVPSLRLVADVNGTCTVDVDDFLTVINEWGNTKSNADINRDEIVNLADLMMVIENWTFK